SGYVDNSLPRVPAHTHCATTTALSLRNSMVDPLRSSEIPHQNCKPALYRGTQQNEAPTVGFRVAFGNCSARGPNLWKSPLAKEVSAAVLARLEDLRSLSSENLLKLPPELCERESIFDKSVEFLTIHEAQEGLHLVVVTAFVRTLKFPTYIGSLGIGHLVAEGLAVESSGSVRDATREEMLYDR
ncbi:MAG: hypothetical protein OEU56_10570, partial [Rhodospirillales bacterium]|nr:hypothetical protein [Rhodospirillales bacterium]